MSSIFSSKKTCSRALRSAFCLAALAPLSMAQVVTIDPVDGVDSSLGHPTTGHYRSVSYAMIQVPVLISALQAAGSPVPALTINLMPGTYSQSSNLESFPIGITAPVTITGPDDGTAIFDHKYWGTPVGQATPAISVTATASSKITMENVRFIGDQRGLDINVLDATGVFITLNGVTTKIGGPSTLDAGTGVTIDASGASDIGLSITGRDSSDLNFGTRVRGVDTSGYLFGIDSCKDSGKSLPFGAVKGVAWLFETLDSAVIGGTMFGSSIKDRSSGVALSEAAGSSISLSVYHSAFMNCGFSSSSPTGPILVGGAIDEFAGAPIVVAKNLAFYACQREIPAYSASTYTLEGNLFQDAGLLAADPSSTTGNPLWVDANSGDFHTLPGSPCLDAGVNLGAGLYADSDFDGDDRLNSCASAPDIGPDESFDTDFYLSSGNSASLGETVAVRLYGDGGSVAVIAVGTPSSSPTCNGNLDGLLPYVVMTSAVVMPGTPGVRSSTTTSFVVPIDPALVGLLIPLGSAHVTTPPGLVAGANLRYLLINS